MHSWAAGAYGISPSQGGANATVATIFVESAAQATLPGSSLQFGFSNDNNLILPVQTLGSSIHYAWEAEAYFDTPGSVLNYAPISNLSISTTPVPEPGSSVLIGYAGLLLLRRRRLGMT